ncbi:hypothetical protein EZV61_09425 [Corallincola luteus]|uniref:Alginate export domain-containing protein n=2 Tax=Corallincola luteus TaxID=1775177 RepID=A0ABY2APT4_9GAMM|nr:hypothetical protein EZV61_09425 [Corallincola luteus]
MGLLLPSVAWATEVRGSIAVQYRQFVHDGAFKGQDETEQVSISAEPELYWEWGDQSITATPFVRLDSMDDERSHSDLRELKWLYLADDYELEVGIAKVFWGVAESQHLVDVINQTDMVEHPNGEAKLGQPMVHLSWLGEEDSVELFLLPYFRERTSSGSDGRFRPPLVVDEDNSDYQSSDSKHHLDLALRWSQTWGDWDVGLAYFTGTNRDPLLNISDDGTKLTPYYEQMDRVSVDIQATKGEWLWKLESIYHKSKEQEFPAAVGGFEYTLVGAFDSMLDVGLLAEYNWHDQDRDMSINLYQNDLFVGTRITLNDMQGSEILAGVTVDLEDSEQIYLVEASRRLGDSWRLAMDIWIYNSSEVDTPVSFVQKDDFAQLEVAYYF